MIQKRYQYRTKDGIQWSEWFEWGEDAPQPKVQLAGFKGEHLLNEYREV